MLLQRLLRFLPVLLTQAVQCLHQHRVLVLRIGEHEILRIQGVVIGLFPVRHNELILLLDPRFLPALRLGALDAFHRLRGVELPGGILVPCVHKGKEQKVMHRFLEVFPVLRHIVAVRRGADDVAGSEFDLRLIFRRTVGQSLRMDIDPVDLSQIRILHQFLKLVHLLLCELDLLAEGRGDTAGAILQHCQIVGVVVLKGRLRRHAGIDIVGDPCVVEGDLHLTHGEVRKLFFRPRVGVVLRRVIGGRRRCHILTSGILDPVMSAVPVGVRPGVGDDPVLRLVVIHVLVDKGILKLQLRLLSGHAALIFLF